MIANGLDGKTQSVLGEMLREACDRGTRLHFKVISGSMRPIIGVGDVITVGRVEPSKVRIGDVVAFQEGQNVVIHRVIGKSAAKNTPLIFRHRGDNGASSGLFQAPNLIGRVLIVEKEGREISLNTSWYVMSNKILGWRLRLADNLDRMKFTHISVVVHLVLRPVWKLYYRLLLNRL